MRLYVQQMQDWNCYAYCAENVEAEYHDFFLSELWWPIGNHFIKTFDNVENFSYCAENFKKYGEASIGQSLRIVPAPWEKALDGLMAEMKTLGVDWYVHGSAAMALWGIDVTPKDLNVIIPNAADFDKVAAHFCRRAIFPFQRCDGWVMSGLGTVFMEANIGFAFHNPSPERFDLSTLAKRDYKGETVYVSTLSMLRRDNQNYGRPERVKLIEEKMQCQ